MYEHELYGRYIKGPSSVKGRMGGWEIYNATKETGTVRTAVLTFMHDHAFPMVIFLFFFQIKIKCDL